VCSDSENLDSFSHVCVKNNEESFEYVIYFFFPTPDFYCITILTI